MNPHQLFTQLNQFLSEYKGKNSFQIQKEVCDFGFSFANAFATDNSIMDSLNVDLSFIKIERQENETIRDYASRLESYFEEIDNLKKAVREIQHNVGTFKNRYLEPMVNLRIIIEKYPHLINAFNEISMIINERLIDLLDILDNAKRQIEITSREKIREELLAQDKAPEKAIVIRCWYHNESKDIKKIAGIESDGHLSIQVGDKYISLYPIPNQKKKEKTFLNVVTHAVGMPSTDDKEGVFRPLLEDLYRLYIDDSEYQYRRCDRVVIDCSQNNLLDYDQAYQWISQLLDKYKSEFNNYRKESYPYNFYTANCSTIVAEGLEKANATAVLMPASQEQALITRVTDIKSPSEVLAYAKAFAKEIKRKTIEQEIKALNEKLNGQHEYTSEKEKYTDIFYYYRNIVAAERISLELFLLKNKDQNDQYKDIISQFQKCEDILLDIIKAINQSTSNDDVYQIINANKETIFNAFSNLFSLSQQHKLEERFLSSFEQLKNLIEIIRIPNTYNIYSTQCLYMFETQLNKLLGSGSSTYNAETFQKASKIATTIQRILPLESNIFTGQTRLALLSKTIRIKNFISELKKEKREEKNAELIKFYDGSIKSLRDMLGNTNQLLYFGTHFSPRENEKENFLAQFKSLVSLKSDALTISDAVIDAKDSFQKEKKEFTNKPSVFKFWRWTERRGMFENQTSHELSLLLNNEKLDPRTKMKKMHELIAKRQPGGWRFWRGEEIERYNDMKQKASLICAFDAFTNGYLDEAGFLLTLDQLTTSKTATPELTNFKQSFLDFYKKTEKEMSSSEEYKDISYQKRFKENVHRSKKTEQTYKKLFESIFPKHLREKQSPAAGIISSPEKTSATAGKKEETFDQIDSIDVEHGIDLDMAYLRTRFGIRRN